MTIDEALQNLMNQFGNKKLEVFKSITGDNGSEFSNLSKIENNGTSVYFTLSYTHHVKKETNECHNKMLRRFIPKGKSMSDYKTEDILFFSRCNQWTAKKKFLTITRLRSCLKLS